MRRRKDNLMRHLYWFLLRLLPVSFRRPFVGIDGDEADIDEEMYCVFAEASSEARSLGRGHYFAFCMREIGGLLAEPFALRPALSPWVLYPPVGAVAGFLLALIITVFLGPEMYTSTAVVYETGESFARPYVSIPKIPPNDMLIPEV